MSDSDTLLRIASTLDKIYAVLVAPDKVYDQPLLASDYPQTGGTPKNIQLAGPINAFSVSLQSGTLCMRLNGASSTSDKPNYTFSPTPVPRTEYLGLGEYPLLSLYTDPNSPDAVVGAIRFMLIP